MVAERSRSGLRKSQSIRALPLRSGYGSILSGQIPGAIIISLLLSLTTPLHAQVTVEPEITTDSVDLFSKQTQVSGKNLGVALLSSLILPGTGHYYMDRQKSALAYFTVEAIALFGAIFCETYSNHLSNDAAHYAWVYANAGGGKHPDDHYWQAVSQFDDIEAFNTVQDLNRTPDQKYLESDQYWHWADQSFREDFLQIRKQSHTLQVAATFFAGALILDRIVSFIELRATSKNINSTSASTISVTPSFSSNFSNVGINVSAKF